MSKFAQGKRRRMTKYVINELSMVDFPAQEGAVATIMKRRDDSEEYWKRQFSAEERKKLAGSGAAMSDGGFPIVNRSDLKNAIAAFGRAKNKGAAAKHIKARAGVLGASDMLPEEGQLAKAAAQGEEFQKAGGIVLLTSSEEGHAHGMALFPGDQGGATWRAWNPRLEDTHDHAWIHNEDGSITVAMNAGHGHTVERPTLVQAFMALMPSARESDGVIAMARKCRFGFTEDGDIIDLIKSGDPGTEDDMTKEEQDALETKLARAEKVAELTDAQKAHLGGLSKKKQETFLAKSAEERQEVLDADVSKKAEADPVVYTDLAGSEYRKSDDARLILSVKNSDALSKRLIASEAVNKAAAFEKRAEEHLPNLPGDLPIRAAIVKALDGIEDEEVRTKASQSIIAGDRAMKAAFTSTGHGDGQIRKEHGGQVAELDTLAKARQTKDSISYEAAYSKVCDENPALAEAAITGN